MKTVETGSRQCHESWKKSRSVCRNAYVHDVALGDSHELNDFGMQQRLTSRELNPRESYLYASFDDTVAILQRESPGFWCPFVMTEGAREVAGAKYRNPQIEFTLFDERANVSACALDLL
jgi:hypothetical protein